MKKVRILAILNLLALLLHIIFAYASQFKLVSAKDVGEISGKYNTLFAPAGFTFSIWGVIYITLAASCIYHIIIAYKHNMLHEANKDTERMGALFLYNNISAAAWLIAWTNEIIGLSLILIIAQLILLIAIHLSLYVHKPGKSLTGIIYTEIPLSIYFGWITIATIANAAAYLVYIHWDGWGISSINWTIIIIVVSVLLSIVVVVSRKNPLFGLVTIWALYGIISKLHAANAAVYKNIIAAAWVGVGMIIAACIVQFMHNVLSENKNRLHEKDGIFHLAHHSLK
ncbi:MAG: hypothetical protein IT249_18490 [Chitinophagaceae bacterium]|nr:hypothetical protein [Chitinophagaceae bacterium]